MLNRNSTLLLVILTILDLTGFQNLSGLANAALNDTGIKTCSNATQNGLPCPIAGFPGQDAEYGTNSFNFTKLDANGNEMPVTATNHVCVQDNVTGLMWEVKTDDGGLRDKDWTYSWFFNNSGSSDYGDNCYNSSRCDTEKFVQDVNATNLCGHNDWRLPNPHELASIVDYSISYPKPTINANYFYNTLGDYWTASQVFNYSYYFWYVGFNYGNINSFNINYFSTYNLAVRLVRSVPVIFDSFLSNGDGTVTDQKSGLMWSKCPEGQSGNDCAIGSAMLLTWQQALITASNSSLAGYSDWRLPNVKELQSLVNYSEYDPSMNVSIFPNTPSQCFWTSSPHSNDSNHSWHVHLGNGNVNDTCGSRMYGFAIRIVRDGQSSPSTFTVTPTAGSGGSVSPSTPQTITSGATTHFTVTPNTGYTKNTAVSGTCPQGNWNGDVWTTGTITANCTVNFSFNVIPITAPTVTTLAATNIAVTSATLNGSVISTGAAATVSFDFGTTTAYGTNLVANPAQVYSSTAVAVSANKTALTCNTLYHYRVKAVNSAGTGYGADKTFTTATCPVVTINSWLFPTNPIVLPTQAFTLAVTAKSNSQQIGSYRYEVTFDVTKLAIDYTQCSASNGVCAGSDAPAFFTANVNYGTNPATITLNGLGAIGPGNDLQLLTIHFKSQNTFSITPVTLKTVFLDNAAGNSIGLEAAGASVSIVNGICGDADGNTRVNIVDALAIARKVVGMPPPPTVDVTLADVNQNGALSIVDALHIARYSVGLVTPPEMCKIGVAL